MKRSILDLYDEFTSKVADARGLDIARVREIAEGRVYMGRAAVELKLVDRVATLDETIREAKRAAGIPDGPAGPHRGVSETGLFRLPGFARRAVLQAEGSTEAAGYRQRRAATTRARSGSSSRIGQAASPDSGGFAP